MSFDVDSFTTYLQLMVKRSPRSLPDGMNISTETEEEEKRYRDNLSSYWDVEMGVVE